MVEGIADRLREAVEELAAEGVLMRLEFEELAERDIYISHPDAQSWGRHSCHLDERRRELWMLLVADLGSEIDEPAVGLAAPHVEGSSS